jgi:hypothetical protein
MSPPNATNMTLFHVNPSNYSECCICFVTQAQMCMLSRLSHHLAGHTRCVLTMHEEPHFADFAATTFCECGHAWPIHRQHLHGREQLSAWVGFVGRRA